MSVEGTFEHTDESARIVDTAYRVDDFYDLKMDKLIEDHIKDKRDKYSYLEDDRRGQILHKYPINQGAFHKQALDYALDKGEEYLRSHYPDYRIDREHSDTKRVIAINDKKRFIGYGIRGTKFSSPSDLVADLEIATGRHLPDPDLKEFFEDNKKWFVGSILGGLLSRTLLKGNKFGVTFQGLEARRNTITALNRILQDIESNVDLERNLVRTSLGQRTATGRNIWVDVPLEETRAGVERDLDEYSNRINWALRHYGYEPLPTGSLQQLNVRTRGGRSDMIGTLDMRSHDMREVVEMETERTKAYDTMIKDVGVTGALGALAWESIHLRHFINWAKDKFTDTYGGVSATLFGRDAYFKSMRKWEGLSAQALKSTGVISAVPEEGELNKRFEQNKEVAKELKVKYPDHKIVPIGHSLGSIQSLKLAEDMGWEGIHINAGGFAHDFAHPKSGNKLQTHLQTIHSETGTPDPVGAIWDKAEGNIVRIPSKPDSTTKLPLYWKTLATGGLMADLLGPKFTASGLVMGSLLERTTHGGLPSTLAYMGHTTTFGKSISYTIEKLLETAETHGLHNFFDDNPKKSKTSKLHEYFDTEHLIAMDAPGERDELEEILHKERNMGVIKTNKTPKVIFSIPPKIEDFEKHKTEEPINKLVNPSRIISNIYIDRYGNTQEFQKRKKKRKYKKRKGGRKLASKV
tara:strand:- start:350 stop:2422 length:2073 start_codon:yes stop_codon:yes gene_type:complete